ncbi:MAG TPA: phospholipid carrier-dependent glycosyltransferase [Phycisphaerae bacterium]|nr:phospholipid carrier-dependent glycosyltransferase [Phycisphaerae bacterium]
MTTERPWEGLAGRDLALLAGFALAVFCFSLVGGRPLTMHEARLPQTAREMLSGGDWVIPRCGGRPWLERPPLPIWITAGVGFVFGGEATEWIYRIPSALCGCGVVLMTGWMAGRWFGRTVGLLTGLMLATMFEFVSYAWLAEQDIFLCAAVTGAIALFVRAELSGGPAEGPRPMEHPLGRRPWAVLLLFVVLGLTNLAKGLAFGTAMALIPMAGFLLANRDRKGILRYLWVWGWAVFLLISLAWPLVAYLHYPDVLDLWKFDHFGRLSGAYASITQAPWYYLVQLPGELAPWTPVALIGLVLACRRAFTVRRSPESFLLCWAVLPIVVFSIPPGKHHHDLLSCLPPWSVLAGLGLVWVRDRVFALPQRARHPLIPLAVLGMGGGIALWLLAPLLHAPTWARIAAVVAWPLCVAAFGLGLYRRNGRTMMASLLLVIVTGYFGLHAFYLPRSDQTAEDTRFLRKVPSVVQPGVPLMINADASMALDVFRVQFYLPDSAVTLHNLTWLLDEAITAPEVYVVARARQELELRRYGALAPVLQSRRSRRETSPADRLTLFHLAFRRDLKRYPRPKHVSPMQAMSREPGPNLGGDRSE